MCEALVKLREDTGTTSEEQTVTNKSSLSVTQNLLELQKFGEHLEINTAEKCHQKLDFLLKGNKNSFKPTSQYHRCYTRNTPNTQGR